MKPAGTRTRWACLTVAAAVAATVGSWRTLHARSSVVRRWVPPATPIVKPGELAYRSIGTGDTTVLLLHGLGATGDYFGNLYDRLATHRQLVIPDLLGFGRSLDEQRASYSLADHLDALDDVIGPAIERGDRIVVGAHSMGTALALAFGQRHRDAVERIVVFGPPLYRSAAALRTSAGEHSTMTRLFLLDSKGAATLCRINCAHRTISGYVMAALTPSLPVTIARQASLHTWPAYHQSLDELAVNADWESLLSLSVPVHLVRGTADNIGDLAYLRELAATRPNIDLHEIPGADHHVALTHPEIVLRLLDRGA